MSCTRSLILKETKHYNWHKKKHTANEILRPQLLLPRLIIVTLCIVARLALDYAMNCQDFSFLNMEIKVLSLSFSCDVLLFPEVSGFTFLEISAE